MTVGGCELLVTGASGLLGWNVACRASGRAVGTYRRRAVEGAPFRMAPLDLADETAVEALCSTLRPRAVIHCAAISDPVRCEAEPEEATEANLRGTARVARAAARAGARLVAISTDLVFDGERGRYRETDPAHPISHYGWTKLRGEEEALAACPDAAVLRVSLLCGSSRTGLESTSERLLAALAAGQTPTLYEDEFRTPTPVGPLAAAVLEFAWGRAASARGVYHLAGPERLSRHALGLRLLGHAGSPPSRVRRGSIRDHVGRPPRAPDTSLESARAAALLGGPLPPVDGAC
ncbi:MAG: SDR family oxidoreductase [Planctomycetes bacterium]|nr:SDR family oxidoreductase [Planctomycetota bacterium]